MNKDLSQVLVRQAITLVYLTRTYDLDQKVLDLLRTAQANLEEADRLLLPGWEDLRKQYRKTKKRVSSGLPTSTSQSSRSPTQRGNTKG